jgi:hypothetical protein
MTEYIAINVPVKYVKGASADEGKYYMVWDHANCKHICDLPVDKESFDRILALHEAKNVPKTPSDE